MSQVAGSTASPASILFGTIRWSALQKEVEHLKSIPTTESVMLDDICGFLQNISQAQWNAMADVNVEIHVGHRIRLVRWTKHLFKAILEAMNHEMTLHALLEVVESYELASRQHITRITTFTQVDKGAFVELLQSLPNVNGCLKVECLIRSLAKLSSRHLKALAREEDEHGYALNEIRISLEAIQVMLNRLVTESKKGEHRDPAVIAEDRADISQRVTRINEIVHGVMEDDWADIWNESAQHFRLPPEAFMPTVVQLLNHHSAILDERSNQSSVILSQILSFSNGSHLTMQGI